MIFNKQQEEALQTIGDIDNLEMDIDMSEREKLLAITTSNLYSNKIGSPIREAVSNSVDSHIEAGTNDPVIVKISKDNAGDYISFIDFGVGISPDRMFNVYAKLLKSTKTNDNKQTGMWGLGKASPFAYTEYYYLNTRFDGTEYQYVVSKGALKMNITKLAEFPTTERNGTEIKIYIKPGDLRRFQEEVGKQLCYFDGVYFDNCGLSNDFTITKGDTFLFKNVDRYSDELHIVLGCVSYPIDWATIGQKKIPLSFGLKFEIGELMVTPNRESISYTLEAIQLINKKIDAFILELQILYNKQDIQTDSLEYFIKNRNGYKYLKIGDVNIRLDNVSHYYDNEKYYNMVRDLPIVSYKPFANFKTIPNDLFFEYASKKEKLNINGTLSTNQGNYENPEKRYNFIYNNNIAFSDIDKKKLKYLVYNHNTVYHLKKIKVSLRAYKDYLSLKHHPKSEWRNIITTFQNEIENYVKSVTINPETVVIPQEYLDSIKQDRKVNTIDRNKEILFYEATTGTKRQTKFSNLEKYPLIIYSDDKEELVNLHNYLTLIYDKYTANQSRYYSDRTKIRETKKGLPIFYFIKTAKVYHKTLQTMNNCITINKFMENYKIISRLNTIEKFRHLAPKYNSNAQLIKIFDKVNSKVADDLKELQHWFTSYDYSKVDRYGSAEVKKQFKEDIIKLATEKGLYNKDLEDKIKRVESYFEGIELVNKLQDVTDKEIPLIVEYLKLKKKRVNLSWYQVPKWEKELMKETEDKVNYLETISV